MLFATQGQMTGSAGRGLLRVSRADGASWNLASFWYQNTLKMVRFEGERVGKRNRITGG